MYVSVSYRFMCLKVISTDLPGVLLHAIPQRIHTLMGVAGDGILNQCSWDTIVSGCQSITKDIHHQYSLLYHLQNSSFSLKIIHCQVHDLYRQIIPNVFIHNNESMPFYLLPNSGWFWCLHQCNREATVHVWGKKQHLQLVNICACNNVNYLTI